MLAVVRSRSHGTATLLLLIAVGGVLAGCSTAQEARVTEGPMERYLAEQIVLDRRISGAALPARAAFSSRSWVAVVELLGSEPQPQGGADLYVRYYAGVPGSGGDLTTPVAGQTGFAVARAQDPGMPSGPVSFRFPRDGSYWESDMTELMPEKYWRGETAGDANELEAAWRKRVQQVEAGDTE